MPDRQVVALAHVCAPHSSSATHTPRRAAPASESVGSPSLRCGSARSRRRPALPWCDAARVGGSRHVPLHPGRRTSDGVSARRAGRFIDQGDSGEESIHEHVVERRELARQFGARQDHGRGEASVRHRGHAGDEGHVRNLGRGDDRVGRSKTKEEALENLFLPWQRVSTRLPGRGFSLARHRGWLARRCASARVRRVRR